MPSSLMAGLQVIDDGGQVAAQVEGKAELAGGDVAGGGLGALALPLALVEGEADAAEDVGDGHGHQ